jgi:hypothetical protein
VIREPPLKDTGGTSQDTDPPDSNSTSARSAELLLRSWPESGKGNRQRCSTRRRHAGRLGIVSGRLLIGTG